MTHSLNRAGSTTTIPAVPATLAYPASFYFIETQVYIPAQPGAGGVYGVIPQGWGYSTVIDSSTGQPTTTLIRLNGTAQVAGSYVANPLLNGRWTTVSKRVDVPATPGYAGSPAVIINDPPLGWTSFAHSGKGIRAGTATFTVKKGIVGAALGFSSVTNPVAGYGHIQHGLLFTNNAVQNLTTGANYGAYVASDVFAITLKNGLVSYTKNGGALASEASVMAPLQPFFLAAAMYAPGDQADNPTITEVLGGSGSMTLPAMQMNAGKLNQGFAFMALPAMVMVVPAINGAHMTMPKMRMLASEADIYGQADMFMPKQTMLAYGGSLAVVLNTRGDMSMPAMIGAAHGLTGQDGTASMVLPAMTMLSADHHYGAAAMVMPAMYMSAYVEPHLEAYMLDTAVVASPMTPAVEMVAVMISGVVVAATMVPTRALDALMQSSVTVAGTMSANAIMEAVMNSLVMVNSVVEIPGSNGETWAYNIEGGGSSTYTNFEFNSFAKIGDNYYGANADGLFLLEGDDDAGTGIEAAISFGKRDFGTSHQKTVAEVFVGVASDCSLLLKVIADGEEYIYKAENWSPDLQQQRFKAAKGVKANYLTFELYNINGGDFEIDTVEFTYLPLSRRLSNGH